MGTVLAPIFEGGKLRANADIAASRRDQAAFAYRKAALSAFQEVEDDLSDVQKLGAKESAAIAQAKDLAVTLAAAKRRFDRGYSSYQEVLDAALVKLTQAMGGGWPGPQALIDSARNQP